MAADFRPNVVVINAIEKHIEQMSRVPNDVNGGLFTHVGVYIIVKEDPTDFCTTFFKCKDNSAGKYFIWRSDRWQPANEEEIKLVKSKNRWVMNYKGLTEAIKRESKIRVELLEARKKEYFEKEIVPNW